MKIYLAGEGILPFLYDEFYDFYRLCSYEYLRKKPDEIKVIHKYKDFILDSGIFTFLNGRETANVDWDKYTFEYGQFVKKHQIKNYVEIDIDTVIGLEEVEKLRARLTSQVGHAPIPVWHMNRGYEKWLEICRDYDYVCFGAFITDGLKRDKYHKIAKFLSDAKKENCKVHGLGFTNFEYLKKLPFYSVDSSSWTIGNRFGSYCKFQGDRVKSFSKPEGTRIKDHKKLFSHNFYEWLKYSRYAESKL